MGYRTLEQCVTDLQQNGHLVVCDDEVDARLEAAEIQRRVYRSGGPAVLFNQVKGCRFRMVSNLFGSLDRARFIFRDTYEWFQKAVEIKVDPGEAARRPLRYWKAPWLAWTMRPKRRRSGPVTRHQAKLTDLPQVVCWPDDGGAFITLPIVYSEDIDRPGTGNSNLGMYRIQYSGNEYEPDREIGLHYQIHRSIGVHHQKAIAQKKPFRVNVFVGGNPALTLAAVLPLPEGMSELGFAGALAGHRLPMVHGHSPLPVYANADFAITGTIDDSRLKPEGPFGDHLGYYSLQHDYPVLKVEKVFHRPNAIWPFTVVGRPPQEDTTFGQLIHDLTGPAIPTVLPGVKSVHAVDDAGVHPLLLATGSERYVPYEETTRPGELLTQANAILGQGQMSLAKYLLIIDENSTGPVDLHDFRRFFDELLSRIDLTRDLHFQTQTTIDTLDYTGDGINVGSKLVVAAAGPRVRELPTEIPSDLALPERFHTPKIVIPGVLAISAPAHSGVTSREDVGRFCQAFRRDSSLCRFPWIVLVDDSDFTARTVSNFLWVTFTRSNPATDIEGVDSFSRDKHWGCYGSMVVDARIKPHHAPPLSEDPEITRKVDALATRKGPLAPYL